MVRLIAGIVGQGLLLGLLFVGLLVLTIAFIATWFAGQYAIAVGCAAVGMGAVALLARINRDGAEPPDSDEAPDRGGRRAGRSSSFSAGRTTWRGRKGGPGGG